MSLFDHPVAAGRGGMAGALLGGPTMGPMVGPLVAGPLAYGGAALGNRLAERYFPTYRQSEGYGPAGMGGDVGRNQDSRSPSAAVVQDLLSNVPMTTATPTPTLNPRDMLAQEQAFSTEHATRQKHLAWLRAYEAAKAGHPADLPTNPVAEPLIRDNVFGHWRPNPDYPFREHKPRSGAPQPAGHPWDDGRRYRPDPFRHAMTESEWRALIPAWREFENKMQALRDRQAAKDALALRIEHMPLNSFDAHPGAPYQNEFSQAPGRDVDPASIVGTLASGWGRDRTIPRYDAALHFTRETRPKEMQLRQDYAASEVRRPLHPPVVGGTIWGANGMPGAGDYPLRSFDQLPTTGVRPDPPGSNMPRQPTMLPAGGFRPPPSSVPSRASMMTRPVPAPSVPKLPAAPKPPSVPGIQKASAMSVGLFELCKLAREGALSSRDVGLDMNSWGGALADVFAPLTFGGTRAGRASQLARATDQDPGGLVDYPVASSFGGTLAGGLAGAGLGGMAGELSGVAGGGGTGALAGAGLGVAAGHLLTNLLRRKRMKQIARDADRDLAENPDSLVNDVPNISTSDVLTPLGGAHRAGQLDVYRALRDQKPLETPTGRNAVYTAELLTRGSPVGTPLAAARGAYQTLSGASEVREELNRLRKLKRMAERKHEGG